jgi:hypothetical protein
MTKPTYKVREADDIFEAAIERTDPDGTVWVIPIDEANSDYQAYLNKDKPQVEHLTEIIPADEAQAL